MAMNFDEIVAAVKALHPAEQWRLRDMIDCWLEPPGPPPTEEEFAQELLREGVLDHVPPPIKDPSAYRSYTPVEIEGKPLSETIIEERR